MFITRIKLKNWRNFREVDIDLREYTYVLGANASGKSNLLDALKFLRDICNPQGGGLQKAISDRGGIKKLRCLHARKDPEIRLEVHLSTDLSSGNSDWIYVLAFKPEGKGAQRILISEETVINNNNKILSRPDKIDKNDNLRLTQTYLEQIQANYEFRELNHHFSIISYLHLVPQFLKHGERIGGRILEDDPYGQGFLSALAKSGERVRASRLKKIERALSLAVPKFKELKYIQDELGHPHLQARYSHHRPKAGWQMEDQFSDGTLRLIGILWSLMDGNGLLLLEEPELSLNNGIVEQIPVIIQRINKESKKRRQIIITTHSEAILSNKGIDANGVVILETTDDGTKARKINEIEEFSINSGLSIAEVILPKTKPSLAEQLSLL